MADCKTCKHSIFDKVWAEYKCVKRQKDIPWPELYKECEYYKKDPNKTKGDE